MNDTLLLRMQHTSLQYSDNVSEQAHDVRVLFEKGQEFPIKTGTEAGPTSGGARNRRFLTQAAEEYNHAIAFAGDNWVAVDREIIRPRSVEKEPIFLVNNDEMATRGYHRMMATLGFQHKELGNEMLYVGATHYATKGNVPGTINYKVNVEMARDIHQWLKKVAEGRNLGFVNGDFNIHDRKYDFALGKGFTSMADELKAWQNTGHGPIDGFCSFDHDGRVTAKRFNVLDDRELFMHSDHFVCRGVWEIQKLKPKF